MGKGPRNAVCLAKIPMAYSGVIPILSKIASAFRITSGLADVQLFRDSQHGFWYYLGKALVQEETR